MTALLNYVCMKYVFPKFLMHALPFLKSYRLWPAASCNVFLPSATASATAKKTEVFPPTATASATA